MELQNRIRRTRTATYVSSVLYKSIYLLGSPMYSTAVSTAKANQPQNPGVETQKAYITARGISEISR
jgi:hypothetical protein